MQWKTKNISLGRYGNCFNPASKGKQNLNAMKNLTSLLFLILVLIGHSTKAQNDGSIRGQVLDSLTKEPAVGANVYVMVGDQMRGTTTDIDGRFHLKPLVPGTYNLVVSYMEQKKTIQVKVNPNQITMMSDVLLTDNLLGEIEVTVYRDPLINPEETSVTTIRYEQIKNNPHIRDINKLAGTIGGVQVSETGQANVRGGRSDAMIYFVDGVKVADGNIRLPGVAIGSLTVYTGGVPAKYGDVTSGVIIVETRSYFDLWAEHNKGK